MPNITRRYDLLDSEYESLVFVHKIGLERAERLLTLVGDRMQRRATRYNSKRVYFDYAYDAFSVAKDWETTLLHKLKIGIGLLDDSNSPYKARQRILERRAKQKAVVLKRKALRSI